MKDRKGLDPDNFRRLFATASCVPYPKTCLTLFLPTTEIRCGMAKTKDGEKRRSYRRK